MPSGVIMMCCMSGCGLAPLSGMVDVSSFLNNTRAFVIICIR